MNKLKIWTAVAGMLCAAGVSAQSSVTVYGIADLSVRYGWGLDGAYRPIPGNVGSVNSGVNQTSRFGFKGNEAISKDTSAFFHLESGLTLDTGAQSNSTKLFDRIALVGLKTTFGQVTAGRQPNLISDTLGIVDPLYQRFTTYNPNIQYAGLSQHGLNADFGGSGTTTSAYRLDNTVKYVGTFADLTARGLYTFSEIPGRTKPAAIGAGLSYTNGPLAIAGQYGKFRDTEQVRYINTDFVGAAYKWNNLQFRGTYGRTALYGTGGRQQKQGIYGAGVTVGVTPVIDLVTALYRLDRSRPSLPKDGFNRAFVFAEYKLSGRSRLYVETDHTQWKGGFQGVGNREHATAVSLGLIHLF